jgi:hypothetical protein
MIPFKKSQDNFKFRLKWIQPITITIWLVAVSISNMEQQSVLVAAATTSSSPDNSLGTTTRPNIPSQAGKPPISGNGFVWGFQAAFGDAHLVKYDLRGNVITSFVPDGGAAGNGRGVAVNTTTHNLYYTVLAGDESFAGDGLIHIVSPRGGSDISTIPDPGGDGGPGIGALDFFGGDLWAISYKPDANNENTIYKLDSNNGGVLANCTIPFAGGGKGVDTLAIFDTSKGPRIYTDAADLLFPETVLYEYQLPSSINQGSCIQTDKFTLPIDISISGIDNMHKKLFGTNTEFLFDFGTSPFRSIKGSLFLTSTGEEGEGAIEDIEYSRS